MLLKLVPQSRDIIENGEVIGVVEATNENIENWIRSVNAITGLNLDWQYPVSGDRQRALVYFAGPVHERSKAISRLERYAYRLVQGKLIAVACDFSRELRPAMTPEQAQMDLGTDEEACDHSMWMGTNFSG